MKSYSEKAMIIEYDTINIIDETLFSLAKSLNDLI